MKYTDKEYWILCEGTWEGIASMFIGIGFVFFLKIPIESNTWKWGIFIGLLFLAMGIYANHKANSIK